MKIDDDVLDPKMREILGDITDQRLAQERDRRFCAVYRQWKQPGAKPGREYHCFHRKLSKRLMIGFANEVRQTGFISAFVAKYWKATNARMCLEKRHWVYGRIL